MPFTVSRAQFEKLVERALAELPPEFAKALDEVSIHIEDRPTPRQLKSLGLADDELLLGLYEGIALPDRSVELSGKLPDRITLFQDDIQQVSDSEPELVAEVRTTVLHELGHYFGMDEEDLDGVGYG